MFNVCQCDWKNGNNAINKFHCNEHNHSMHNKYMRLFDSSTVSTAKGC